MIPGWELPTRLRLDTLHVVDAGVAARFSATVLHRALWGGIWGATDEDHVDIAFRSLKSDLQTWYAQAPDPKGDRLGQIFKLTQLGPWWKPMLRCRAAESKLLLGWALEIAETYKHAIEGGAHLCRAGAALAQWYKLLKRAGRQLSRRQSRSYTYSCACRQQIVRAVPQLPVACFHFQSQACR